jgi:hypothetical protein
MTLLRYFMWLSLIVWLGGVIFFAAVLAPTVFSVLPTRHLAGNVVSRSLFVLHWMGIVCGIVFLVSSILDYRLSSGTAHFFSVRHVLMVFMLALTLISQLGITPKMATLRSSMGDIDAVSVTDPAHIAFDSLHIWSTRLEGGVLLLGLAVVYLTAKSS